MDHESATDYLFSGRITRPQVAQHHESEDAVAILDERKTQFALTCPVKPVPPARLRPQRG